MDKWNRQYLKMLGKFLIEHDEKWPASEGWCPAWTPWRWVSAGELEELKDIRARHTHSRPSGIVTLRTNAENVVEGSVFSPGFYRVEKKTRNGMFMTACAGGFPEHHRSRVIKAYESWMHDRYKRGKEKLINKAELSDKKREVMQAVLDQNARDFFNTLAMASAVGGEA